MTEIPSESLKTSMSTYPMAVIELGTSAIRMAIGETDGVTGIRMLEQLVRGVSLGKDTFTRNEIHRETLAQCVDVLKSYRQKLDEYQCTNPQHIRVVATSAIREATNRMAFLDRIYTATGLVVEPIDDAEIARVTYLGIRPLLEKQPELCNATTMLMEVGGGNTEVLLLQGKDILHSSSYRLGSIRLQQMVRQYHASREQAQSIMSGQIERTLEPLRDAIPPEETIELLALGGDIRFAASFMQLDPSTSNVVRIPVNELRRLTDQLSTLTVDQIARKHHLELSQAETLVPALLTNLQIATMLGTDFVLVTSFNLRDALLQGMLRSADWSDDFREQIVRSATELSRHYQVDLEHARHVADLSQSIFQSLAEQHNMDVSAGMILHVASLLHEIGQFVSVSAYHKHSQYLINSSEIFGLNAMDHRLVSLVARYHRRAVPKPSHVAFAALNRDQRVVVSRLSAILRIAVSLAHSRTRRIRDIVCKAEKKRLVIQTEGSAGDLSLEELELRQNSGLFEDVFGLQVLLREHRP